MFLNFIIDLIRIYGHILPISERLTSWRQMFTFKP